LQPHISKCVADWKNNHDGEEDPDDYFHLLKSALTDYQEELSTEIEAVALIDAGLAEIQ
jgi:hypothetical protein